MDDSKYGEKLESHSVMNGKSIYNVKYWHGWLPLDELLIKKDDKILNCLDW